MFRRKNLMLKKCTERVVKIWCMCLYSAVIVKSIERNAEMNRISKNALMGAGLLVAVGIAGLEPCKAQALESWSVQEVYTNKLKLDEEAENACKEAEMEPVVDCIKNYHYARARESDFNLVTKLVNQRALVISAVNPATKTMRIIFNDRSLRLEGWSPEAGNRVVLKNMALTWSLIDGSELSRFSDISKLKPNEEIEVQFGSPEIAPENLALRIYYDVETMASPIGGYSRDADSRYFEYNDCVNSPDYQVGMECVLYYSEREGWSSNGEELEPSWVEENGGKWMHTYVPKWPDGYESNEENKVLGTIPGNTGDDEDKGPQNGGGEEDGDGAAKNEEGKEEGSEGRDIPNNASSEEGDSEGGDIPNNASSEEGDSEGGDIPNNASSDGVKSDDGGASDSGTDSAGNLSACTALVPKTPDGGGSSGGAKLENLENWTMLAATGNLGLLVIYWGRNRRDSKKYKKVKKS